MSFKNLLKNQKSFTLVELLIVIAIIAVLAVAVILILNPQEMIKSSRDSRRLEDLQKLNKAISWFETDIGGKEFMGTSSIVYVSIPDSTSTCANLGLPTLPSGWSYRCVSSSTLQNIDGTGWIPINFNKISFGRTLSKLPIDPVNNTSTGNYYTYVTGGSWELTALLESNNESKTKSAIYDGGAMPGVYEIGTDLKLGPFTRDKGLVGYWSFDEGSGTTAYDYSGNGNNGTMYSSTTIADLHTSSNCKIGSCASFDGVDDYVRALTSGFSFMDGARTVIGWINDNGTGSSWGQIIHYGNGDCTGKMFGVGKNGGYLEVWGGCKDWNTGLSILQNQWLFVAVTYDRNNLKAWLNNQVGSKTSSNFITQNSNLFIGAETTNNGSSLRAYFKGLIDEVRIYNRALSDAEIKAIYEATK